MISTQKILIAAFTMFVGANSFAEHSKYTPNEELHSQVPESFKKSQEAIKAIGPAAAQSIASFTVQQVSVPAVGAATIAQLQQAIVPPVAQKSVAAEGYAEALQLSGQATLNGIQQQAASLFRPPPPPAQPVAPRPSVAETVSNFVAARPAADTQSGLRERYRRGRGRSAAYNAPTR